MHVVVSRQGKRFDTRLAELGAERFYPLGWCKAVVVMVVTVACGDAYV